MRIIQKIYDRTTADEQRWIARIILKGETMLSFCGIPVEYFLQTL